MRERLARWRDWAFQSLGGVVMDEEDAKMFFNTWADLDAHRAVVARHGLEHEVRQERERSRKSMLAALDEELGR